VESRLAASIILMCSGLAGLSQVPPPKPESRFTHLFRRHWDDPYSLERRYQSLTCALVVIRSGDRLGTGFYISADGDVATASHVLGDRTFEPAANGTMTIQLILPTTINVRNATGSLDVPAVTSVQNDADQWSVDLAVLKTGKPAVCWVQIGGDKEVRPGQHVISLGFPGLAFGSLSLYTGIVSAKVKSDLVVGYTKEGSPLRGNNDLIRVQMPISPGISGAPVIDDNNRAIGVITTAGAWGLDLESLTQAAHMGAFGQAPQNTMNLPSVVAHLAEIFHDYASPGYGDAVPLSYLKKQAVQQSASPGH
jgi:S1-C subfamily serine protease